jgi:hypothetical protein
MVEVLREGGGEWFEVVPCHDFFLQKVLSFQKARKKCYTNGVKLCFSMLCFLFRDALLHVITKNCVIAFLSFTQSAPLALLSAEW